MTVIYDGPDRNFAIVLERVGMVEITEPVHQNSPPQQPTRYGIGWGVHLRFIDGAHVAVKSWPCRYFHLFGQEPYYDADLEASDGIEATALYEDIRDRLAAL